MHMLMAQDFRSAKMKVAELKLMLAPLKYAAEKMLVHKPPQDDQYYVPLMQNPFPTSALEQCPKGGAKKAVIIDYLESFSEEVYIQASSYISYTHRHAPTRTPILTLTHTLSHDNYNPNPHGHSHLSVSHIRFRFRFQVGGLVFRHHAVYCGP